LSNTGSRPVYRVNSQGRTKPQPKLVGSWVEARTKEMLRRYWQDYNLWKRLADTHWIKLEVVVAIAFADTHLWYAVKTKNNIGNVNNTDSWKTRTPTSLEQWIEAIFNTLNNKYLGEKQTVWDLSYAGNCKIRCDKVYATSNENREINILNTLSNIYQVRINADFLFRK